MRINWIVTYFSGYGAVFASLYYLYLTANWTLYLASILWWLVACRLIMQVIGLHKYWAHKSFDTGPIGKFILTWGCILCGTGSPYNWAIHHRHHHRTADKEDDIHSPITNRTIDTLFGLWIFKPDSWWKERNVKTVHRDLIADRNVMHIHKYYHHYWYALVILTAIFDWRITLLFVLQPVGLNIVMHGVNNYFSHTNLIPGNYRNYDVSDNSRNLPGWTNLLLLGEGYHHNHHAHPWNYDNAEHSGEWDLSAAIIRKFFDKHRGRLGSEYKRKGSTV